MNKNNLNSVTKVLINGSVYFINVNKLSTLQLKNYLYPERIMVVIEQNLMLLDSNEIKTMSVSSLDKLEFISIVGGG